MVRVEDVAEMAGASEQTGHGFVKVCIDRRGDVPVWVGRAETDAAYVFGGVLLAARHRVAHVWFEAVGSPVAKSTVRAHVFGVRLGGDVVVKGYFVKVGCGSGSVDQG